MQNDNQPRELPPMSGTLDMHKEAGMFVVIYRHHVSPERVLGVALSLHGAMRIALDSGEIPEMSVETEPGVWGKAPVSSDDERCVDSFQWWDDSKVIWGISDFKPGHLGSQALEARFQDEGTGIYCHWTTDVRD